MKMIKKVISGALVFVFFVVGSFISFGKSEVDFSDVLNGMTITARANEAATTSMSSNICLTANITPFNARNPKVDWSVEWEDPVIAMEDGLSINDYVRISTPSDGALTADLVCLAPFDYRILVKATSRANSNLAATCTVDYLCRLQSASLSVSAYQEEGHDGSICISTPTYFDKVYKYGTGTLTGDVSISMMCCFTQDFIEAVKNSREYEYAEAIEQLDQIADSFYVPIDVHHGEANFTLNNIMRTDVLSSETIDFLYDAFILTSQDFMGDGIPIGYLYVEFAYTYGDEYEYIINETFDIFEIV